MRKLDLYIRKYGDEMGRKLYHALQSQAAHAGVSARLRKKIEELTGRRALEPKPVPVMPLFDRETEALAARDCGQAEGGVDDFASVTLSADSVLGYHAVSS